MKPKQMIRMAVDLAMTGVLLALMAYMRTGQELHEWLGVAELVLFIVHHILNAGWLKNLGRGTYGPYRVLQTALAALVLLTMLGSMVSGIWMSRFVFDFLPTSDHMSLARTAHMLCAYWGFLLLSAHLGLHWGMLLAMARKEAGLKAPSAARTWAARLAALGIAAYGAYAFAKHRIYDYLFLRSQFVFFDFEQPSVQFFAEYLAMMGLFVWLAYYGTRLLQRRSIPAKTAKESDTQEETT